MKNKPPLDNSYASAFDGDGGDPDHIERIAKKKIASIKDSIRYFEKFSNSQIDGVEADISDYERKINILKKAKYTNDEDIKKIKELIEEYENQKYAAEKFFNKLIGRSKLMKDALTQKIVDHSNILNNISKKQKGKSKRSEKPKYIG